MLLKDYIDTRKMRELQSSFSEMAGFESVIVDIDGNCLTDKKDFLESGETATYDIVVNGEQLGSVVTPQSSDRKVKRAAEILSMMIGQAASIEYLNHTKSGKFDSVKEDIKKSGELVQTINEKTGHLKGIAKKQTILSLNATIEAARSGEAGVGFAVVAKSMQELSNQSAGIYTDIETSVEEITSLINMIIDSIDSLE